MAHASSLRRINRQRRKYMSIPQFTMRSLLQAGVHFGHNPRKWNPKMEQYIFGTKNHIHIINLEKTVPMLKAALQATHDIAKNGGRFLFVGTKRQAGDIVKTYAEKCSQYYVNHRWLGGMLTNWHTVSQSIIRLKNYEELLSKQDLKITKKELLKLTRKRDKLELSLGGIKELGGIPDMLFVLDTNKERIAIQEANNLGIPVVAIIDTNSDPRGVDYPIPGNDDAIRSIELYCDLICSSILSGLQEQMMAAGVDLGEAADFSAEDLEISEEITEAEVKTEA